LKKTIQYLLKHYVSFWLISTFGLYLFILYTSTETIILDISAKGLNVFIEVFKIPLYYFTANIGIYTIILTHRRIIQTQTMLEQSNRRLEQTDEQIKILQKQEERSKEQIKVLQNQENRNQIIYFENTFFKLLEILRIYVNNLDVPAFGKSGKGKNSLRSIHEELKKQSKDEISNTSFSMTFGFYLDFDKDQKGGVQLKAYIENIKIVLRHLYFNKNIEIDIDDYLEIFISQLNKYEIHLIYYYYKFVSDEDFVRYFSSFEDTFLKKIPDTRMSIIDKDGLILK